MKSSGLKFPAVTLSWDNSDSRIVDYLKKGALAEVTTPSQDFIKKCLDLPTHQYIMPKYSISSTTDGTLNFYKNSDNSYYKGDR